ncbi:MAG: TetR/AcrR family transcriptional regulator C-terminal domain-containing protein, partial [Candidatus Omnitrophota bacterium]
VTDGALYRHFRSKKDILSLLIEDIEQTLIGVISQVASQDKNPIEKLENIFFAHFQYTEQRRGTSFIIINETLNINDKSLREKMKNVLDKYFKIIESILSQGKHSGDFRQDLEVDVAGVVFFGMVQSTVTLWSLSGYEPALDNGWLGKMFSVYKTGIVNGIL